MNILENYSKCFGYTEFKPENSEHTNDKQLYLKKTKSGEILVIEKILNDKYVNFYYNDNQKIFKESDLMLAVLNKCPVAWEVEDDYNR